MVSIFPSEGPRNLTKTSLKFVGLKRGDVLERKPGEIGINGY